MSVPLRWFRASDPPDWPPTLAAVHDLAKVAPDAFYVRCPNGWGVFETRDRQRPVYCQRCGVRL